MKEKRKGMTMTKIISAFTLDDALYALGELVAQNEARGERNFVFCEDQLTLLAERAVLDAVGATFLTEVSTFSRFLSSERHVLSKYGSVMAVSSIMTHNRDKLAYFRNNLAAQTVYETIAQLSASCVGADLLLRGAEETEGTLKGKLLDLAFLLERYESFLQENGLVDESGYLSLLPEKISSSDLRDAHIFFFAFPSFTKQGRAGVEAALDCAMDVTGIFLAGRDELYTNEGAHSFRKLCNERGGAEILRVPDTSEEDARHFRQGLFSPERYGSDRKRTERVRRFTAADESREAETVAALIRRYAAKGMRYREMAVLVPDSDCYPTVEKAFAAYKIPFFADKKRPFSEHPFCELVFAVLEGAADGVLPEEADAILSNVYLKDTDEYRNYLLRFGCYRGAYRREIKSGEAVKGFQVPELVEAREKLRGAMSLFPSKGTACAYADGVFALYERLQAEETTERLEESFTGAERQFLDVKPLWDVLDEIRRVAGDGQFSAREFSAMLKSGTQALEISMIPQSADAVFVGDATDSRFQCVKVLFATGLTDDLPRVTADTAVISDGEIDRLKELEVEIEPAIAQVNARARERIALNLCSFRDELYLSYPLSKKGAEANCGELFSAAEKLFSMPPMPDLFPYDCCERGVAVRRLLSLREELKNGSSNENRRAGAQFAALYEALRAAGEQESVDRVLAGDGKQNVPVKKLLEERTFSPTFFEKYFACPYRGFAENILNLREREEGSARPLDTGNFIHNVLERASLQFDTIKSEEECRAMAQTVAKEMLAMPALASLADTADGTYTLTRLVAESVEVVTAAYRQIVGSQFRVRNAEEAVALDELRIKGRTDRVDVSDEYVRIIDYKTGSYDVSPVKYYTGQKLQLQLYLKAASRGGVPAGAFYFPAADHFTKEGDGNKYRLEGFYCGEDEVLARMDVGIQEADASELFVWKRSARGEKPMDREAFEAFLDYGVLVAQRAENEMKRGYIAPSPYEKACEFCRMKSLCGFIGTERKEPAIKNSEIVNIVRRERGEKV